MSFTSLLARQIAFSRATFGPDERTNGVLDHITKEIQEVRESRHALDRSLEWTDIHLLARDGHWRAVAAAYPNSTTDQIAEIVEGQIIDKQSANELRDWPDWRNVDPDKAIEHTKVGTNADWPSFNLIEVGLTPTGSQYFRKNQDNLFIHAPDMEVLNAVGNHHLVAIRRSVAIKHHLMPASEENTAPDDHDEYVTLTLYPRGEGASFVKLSRYRDSIPVNVEKVDIREAHRDVTATEDTVTMTLRKSTAIKARLMQAPTGDDLVNAN